MTLVREAQALGERGFRVHPLKSKSQPYTAYSRTATSDPSAIAVLWQYFPDALIGICTGQGLVVVDDDRAGDEDPDESMPETLVAVTGRGYHYYFSCPTPVRNSTSKIAPGIDVRGEGGYVLAPPAGDRWWLKGCPVTPLALLPSVLLAACLRTEPQAGAFEPRSHVPAGERHDYLVRFAGWALANELADDLGSLVFETYTHALEVCEPWPAGELHGVHRHIFDLCKWVIARESGRG